MPSKDRFARVLKSHDVIALAIGAMIGWIWVLFAGYWVQTAGSVGTVIAFAAGGLVTSTGSGLAVPDWPSTYGYFMYAFPISGMVGGILYEHGHRLIASTVGLMTIVLAVWLIIEGVLQRLGGRKILAQKR